MIILVRRLESLVISQSLIFNCAVWCSTFYYIILHYSALKYSIMQCSAIQYNTGQWNTLHYSTIQKCAIYCLVLVFNGIVVIKAVKPQKKKTIWYSSAKYNFISSIDNYIPLCIKVKCSSLYASPRERVSFLSWLNSLLVTT